MQGTQIRAQERWEHIETTIDEVEGRPTHLGLKVELGVVLDEMSYIRNVNSNCKNNKQSCQWSAVVSKT